MVFFDTDCLAAFLWVRREYLLVQLCLGQLILPYPVFKELLRVPPLRKPVNGLLHQGYFQRMEILTGTPEARTYFELTTRGVGGLRPLGNGEAAALTLAKAHNGFVASNNFRDIGPYLSMYSLRNLPTGFILGQAHANGLITEAEGNQIWTAMLSRDTARKYLFTVPAVHL
jgi:hypothetical protein